MKRKIFTLGLLSLAFSANAQSLLGVQDQASLHIKEDILFNNLYNDKITKPTLSKNVSAIILLNNLTLSNKKAIKHQI